MKKQAIQMGIMLLAGVVLATVTLGVAQDYPWTPERPITIIVPWAAGGATDQVTRVVAGEIEAALGQSVVIVNQPGASGVIGTTSALEADRDGYTWTAGGAGDLGTYAVRGTLDTRIEDWHLFLSVANVAVVSVNPTTPYQDFAQLLEALVDPNEVVVVGTAGVNSSGHNAIELISQTAGGDYRHVAYEGGNPAVIATVAGEVQVTTQLAGEQVEMIRGDRLRPLAVLSGEALEIEGYGEIPPITNWLPEIPLTTNYFGIWAPVGIPDEVVETMQRIWDERISNSEVLQNFALERGSIVATYYGDEAQERVFDIIQERAWTLYDAGDAEVSPDELGIPRRD